MNDFTKGQLTELCQAVYRGVKPCAMILIRQVDKVEAEIICNYQECKFIIKPNSNKWITFWIYVNDQIPRVINYLPNKPETTADHYLLGALLGYSSEMICKYIENH